MPKPHPIETDIRNAFDVHDRDAFESAMRRLAAMLPSTTLAPCSRGPACVCVGFEQRSTCGYLSARPAGGL